MPTSVTPRRYIVVAIFISLCLWPIMIPTTSANAQTSSGTNITDELAHSFQEFLREYAAELKLRNIDYLKSVHPNLPEHMSDFFIDVTLDMMKYSEAEDLNPTIECQEYGVCKVTYPQPNNSWAAQQFIFYENSWRILDQ